MADDKSDARKEMADELEGVVAGAGVVASKSQTRGGAGGLIGFGFVGLVLGVLLGLTVFGGLDSGRRDQRGRVRGRRRHRGDDDRRFRGPAKEAAGRGGRQVATPAGPDSASSGGGRTRDRATGGGP